MPTAAAMPKGNQAAPSTPQMSKSVKVSFFLPSGLIASISFSSLSSFHDRQLFD
jgi:hypothetical protein